MKETRVHLQWSKTAPQARFSTGVSLHSHTLHSLESLDFIYRLARKCPAVGWALRRGEAHYQSLHGSPLDLRRGWWTPPLAPRDAHAVELDQIQSMGLAPIVSLTDHDDIDAPMALQAIQPSRKIPVSVEWTVPFRNTIFHLGVHNIPASRARMTMDHLKAFTERPRASELQSILASLHADPGMLTIFNHPLWDEMGIGAEQHRTSALAFLSQYGEYLHAVELNGLRPWQENASVIRMARELSKPVISGGDRHALEPNATLNLTNAGDFAEFAGEVRSGWSDVLVASHYRTAHAVRIVRNILDVLRPYENHGLGWTKWPDRVFYTPREGKTASLSQLFGERSPVSVGVLAGFMRCAGQPPARYVPGDWHLQIQQKFTHSAAE